MKLNILSSDKTIYSGETDKVTVPGELGSFTILKNHAPIISSLTDGTIKYTTADGKEKELKIKLGFVEMSNNVVSICISE
ncbi:MAG: ATP synthase F1 subunit epsilon [Bacteroidales bacterium]